MSKVNTLLSKRLKRGENSQKMAILAQKSAAGDHNGLAGIFGRASLSADEEEALRELLNVYGPARNKHVEKDLEELKHVTCEVKAINHQAALLHGERIRRAQDVLRNYQEGAFTAWLIATYGNRQTPYNFLQYYLFYQQLRQDLRAQVESMPRQAIYSLASRHGDFNTKQQIVESYAGESKRELIQKIRDVFPLDEKDRRRANTGEQVLSSLQRAYDALNARRTRIGSRQKENILEYLSLIETLIDP